MGSYATNADVAKRLPGRELSATSAPSTLDVDGWVEEAEAELEAELDAQGLTVPVSSTRGKKILKAKVVSYATARWLGGLDEVATSDDQTREGDLMREYFKFRDDIRAEPSRVAAMLGQAAGDVGGPTVARDYINDNPDGLTVDNGDFDPTFKRGQSW